VGVIAGIVFVGMLLYRVNEQQLDCSISASICINMMTATRMLPIGNELMRRRFGADKLQTNHEEEQDCRNKSVSNRRKLHNNILTLTTVDRQLRPNYHDSASVALISFE